MQTDNQFPSYLVGADNHNIGNSGTSWFSDLSTLPERGLKLAATSILSGASSVYNTGVTLANFLGADAQVQNTGAWITSLDADLGQYYSENRQAADLVGFFATGLLPGIGGVKILNAGQKAISAGKFGGAISRNMGSYTGLLTNGTETYVKLAGAEIAAGQATFSAITGNSVKALASGFTQGILETAAFETFATLPQLASPVLEKQDTLDITKNIFVGALTGGLIQGALTGAVSVYGIRQARVAADLELRTQNIREVIQAATTPADKIILAEHARTNGPEIYSVVAGETNAELEAVRIRRLQQAAADKSARIDNDQRSALHQMTVGSGNPELANMVADAMLGKGEQQILSNFVGATKLSHATHSEGKMVGESLRWVKLHGDDAGIASDELPQALKLADRAYPSSHDVTLKQAVDTAVGEHARKGVFRGLFDPLSNFTTADGWMLNEARFVYVDTMGALAKDALVHTNDVALLSRYLKEGNLDFRISSNMRDTSSFNSLTELKDHIVTRKAYLAEAALASRSPAATHITTETVARSIDVSRDWIEGTREIVNVDKQLFWNSHMTEQYAAYRASIGRSLPEPTPFYYVPEWAKIHYDTKALESYTGHTADAIAEATKRQKLIEESADRVVAKQAGAALFTRMPKIETEYLFAANSAGAAPGAFSQAAGGYDGKKMLSSITQYLGGVSKDLRDTFRKRTVDNLTKPLYDLANNQAAAVEAYALNQQIARTTERYVLDAENVTGFGENVWVAEKLYRAAKSEKQVVPEPLQPGAAPYLKISNWETRDFLIAHARESHAADLAKQERWAALGKVDQKVTDPNLVTLRPFRHDPRDFEHFAFVKDDRVTGAGHTTMLFANSAQELENLVTATRQKFPEFRVLYKAETTEFKQAEQSYLYDRSLNENYIDSSLKSKGVFSPFYTKSDPKKIVDEILNYHVRQAETGAAEVMRLKYNHVFSWLEDQAAVYSRVESSKFRGATISQIEDTEKNPYISYIKSALNLSTTTKAGNPWYSANKLLDEAVSKLVGKYHNSFDSAKSLEELEATNKILQDYGHNTAFANAAEEALINHTAPRGELTKFVRSANAILSRFTLGLDPLNALNNAIGANVLRGTELTQITRAIKEGNSEISGKLAELSRVGIPGTPDSILSPAKLLANSIARFTNSETRGALLAEYKTQGFIRDRLEQFASIFDDFTLRGTESVSELNKRVNKAWKTARELADKGESISGNKFAEEFNRFMSADVMRQLTDLGERAGVLSRGESLAMINTFVNRVEGTIIASQRPGAFQGPIGQAIGLFQSYQFNMMQNLFRYVAEGTKKDTAMLLGLQGTFYGLQGEPGFKLLNDHIIGTMSGNQDHRDVYDTTRGIVGTTAGNWLLYGTASNILQTNLYSRGDINPRSLSILPTSLAEIPFVGGMSKVFGSLYETTQKIAEGAPVWESIRQGIEHNGVSRPLAGLAQVAAAAGPNGVVYSTSGKGTIIGSNDLLSLASLSRLAGGRPLDEAIVNDTMYSIHAYEAVDRKRKNLLAESIKTSVIGGRTPASEDVQKFTEGYVALGGKPAGFNSYMMNLYTKANTSEAETLRQKLTHPMTYKLQGLLGGYVNEN